MIIIISINVKQYEKWYIEKLCFKIMFFSSMYEHVSSIFIKLWRHILDSLCKYSNPMLSKASSDTSWSMAVRIYMSRDLLALFYSIFIKNKNKNKKANNNVKRLVPTFLTLLILFSISVIWWRHVLDACHDDMSIC